MLLVVGSLVSGHMSSFVSNVSQLTSIRTFQPLFTRNPSLKVLQHCLNYESCIILEILKIFLHSSRLFKKQ